MISNEDDIAVNKKSKPKEQFEVGDLISFDWCLYSIFEQSREVGVITSINKDFPDLLKVHMPNHNREITLISSLRSDIAIISRHQKEKDINNV